MWQWLLNVFFFSFIDICQTKKLVKYRETERNCKANDCDSFFPVDEDKLKIHTKSFHLHGVFSRKEVEVIPQYCIAHSYCKVKE